ncbi:sensor histidine kinase [Nocardioides lacusdianchii]|uniref:sensor histidine kinase n=1 Tax=Nocardioides lacusdianchii TaxID=2783664 RepID=UPI001CC9746F|nr:ATP-binding protein [Nocardioides lacusdianchii]
MDQLDPSAPSTPTGGEESLAQSSERYASMFTHHPHAAYSVDVRGYFTDANGRALEMTGLTLEEMHETHFSEVIHPEDKHLLEGAFGRAMAGEPQVVEARVLRPDGVVVDIRCTGIPLVLAGEIVGIHGITEDITEAKQLLRDLEEANLAKTLFLATVSHELRTPLAALVGATDLLMASDLEAEPAHFSRLIHRSGQRLMHLVHDLLEFSGLEAHQTVLHPRPFDVRELVEDVAEWAVPFAESRDLSISFVVDEVVPRTAVGDARRITQVVTNLVQNALTFTSACGSVCVRVRAGAAHSDAAADSTWVEFTVVDNGIGIAEEHVESLFDPFTQTDRFTAREQRGIGLGLAICRALVDLMGGRLDVSSALGEGSTFTFAVPLGRADEPARASAGG